MDRVDFTFDEYQANVLRTANRNLDWNQTIENCLLGLIGELAEVATDLNPDTTLLKSFVSLGVIAEFVKKHKYHGKLIQDNAPKEQVNSLLVVADQDSTFNVNQTANLPKELGDLMFYLVWLIDTLGYDASEIAQQNVEKLRKRYGDGFSVEKSLNRQN